MLYQLPQETMTYDIDLSLLIFIRDGTIDKYSIYKMYKNPHSPYVSLRIALLADLLDVYGYSLNRIEIDVPFGKKNFKQSIDIVVYGDDEHQKPIIAIFCSKVSSGKQYHKELIRIVAQAKKMGVRYVVHELLEKRTIIALSSSDKNNTKETLIKDIPSYMGE